MRCTQEVYGYVTSGNKDVGVFQQFQDPGFYEIVRYTVRLLGARGDLGGHVGPPPRMTSVRKGP